MAGDMYRLEQVCREHDLRMGIRFDGPKTKLEVREPERGKPWDRWELVGSVPCDGEGLPTLDEAAGWFCRLIAELEPIEDDGA